MTDGTRQAVQL